MVQINKCHLTGFINVWTINCKCSSNKKNPSLLSIKILMTMAQREATEQVRHKQAEVFRNSFQSICKQKTNKTKVLAAANLHTKTVLNSKIKKKKKNRNCVI